MPIADATGYKAYIGESTTAYDAVLAILMPAVQADLERSVGYAFDSDTYTDEAIDGDGGTSIWVKHRPVTALTTVKTKATDGTTTTLASTEYRHNPLTGEIVRLGGWAGWDDEPVGAWPAGTQNILVTYTAGYASAPDDLVLLFYTLIDAALDRRGDNWAISQATDGIEARTWLTGKAYIEAKAELIRNWRKVVC